MEIGRNVCYEGEKETFFPILPARGSLFWEFCEMAGPMNRWGEGADQHDISIRV